MLSGVGGTGSVLDAVICRVLLLLLEQDAAVDQVLILPLLTPLVGLLLLEEALVLLVLRRGLLLLRGGLGWCGGAGCGARRAARSSGVMVDFVVLLRGGLGLRGGLRRRLLRCRRRLARLLRVGLRQQG